MAKSISKPVPTDEVVFENPQYVKWLKDKDVLVKEGREISKQIEELEKEIQTYVEKEKEITAKVFPKELIDEGNALRDKINEEVKELERIGNAIRDEKLKAIPKEMETEHLALTSKREKLEQERNKIALKVQKIKDRLIPKLQREMAKHLGEFEDLLSAELTKDKDAVVIKKFSHLQEWKRQWKAKYKNNVQGS